MSKRIRIRITALLLFISLITGARFSYSAINERIFSTIKIAYMNGYAEALQSDIEFINLVKKDEELFKKSVLEAAEKYISTVRKMNDSEKDENSQEKEE